MPLRLRAHAQRGREQQREDHDEANLQRALARHEVQDGRRAHEQSDGDEDEDEADDHVDAAFTVEVDILVVRSQRLFRGCEDFLDKLSGGGGRLAQLGRLVWEGGREGSDVSYLHHFDGQAPGQSILDGTVEPAILLAIREGYEIILAVDELGLLRRKGLVAPHPGDEGFCVS